VKFLVDNQLPVALAQHLQTRGFDCQHVLEVGLAEASDAEVCRYADEQGRIIITKMKIFSISPTAPTLQLEFFGCAWATVGLRL
jgi:predicted nuclease of predicted toxin-antitoxin system